jgi:transposase
MTRAELRVAMESCQTAVRELLTIGSASPTSKTANTCRQILRVEAALWTFVHVDGVEPTNNEAERTIRPAVMWRKTSFGADSERGARFVERILTTAATCRRQGRDVVEFLTQTILAHRSGTLTPSLLPQASS